MVKEAEEEQRNVFWETSCQVFVIYGQLCLTRKRSCVSRGDQLHNQEKKVKVANESRASRLITADK